MPWEKSFDRSEALEKAMMVFWQKGYKKTSVADIVAATGASRYGLYDEFGDKHALYLAALDHYEKNPVAWMLGDLDNLYLTLRDRQYSLGRKLNAIRRFLTPSPFKTKHEVYRWSDPAPAWYELKQYLRDILK